MANGGHLRIDVDSVLRKRVPGAYRYIPRFVVRWLERTICQEEMNGILERTQGTCGSRFCDATLRDLGIDYRVSGEFPDKELFPTIRWALLTELQ